jgi:prepilin-type N-terminal cleavage/methylation domain-containing protein
MRIRKMVSQKGFSLIELAVGLAVLTVLILAVSVSAGLRDNARVQSAANSVQTLRTAAESYLASGNVSYAGLTVDTLKTAKVLPEGFTGTKTNPWGGDYNVVVNNADKTRFDITLSSLAKTEADKLTNYFNNSATKVAYDDTSSTWTVTF